MAEGLETILNKPEFNSISSETKRSLIKLADDVKGKSPTEAIGEMIKFQKNMPENSSLTKVEKEAMFMAVFSSLSKENQEIVSKFMSNI